MMALYRTVINNIKIDTVIISKYIDAMITRYVHYVNRAVARNVMHTVQYMMAEHRASINSLKIATLIRVFILV